MLTCYKVALPKKVEPSRTSHYIDQSGLELTGIKGVGTTSGVCSFVFGSED